MGGFKTNFLGNHIPLQTGRSQAFFLPAPGGNKFLLIEVAPFLFLLTAGRFLFSFGLSDSQSREQHRRNEGYLLWPLGAVALPLFAVKPFLGLPHIHF
jgi:hypothetical protein